MIIFEVDYNVDVDYSFMLLKKNHDCVVEKSVDVDYIKGDVTKNKCLYNAVVFQF